MVSLRNALSRALVAGALCLPAIGVFVPSDASASVSIAVSFDALVKDADSVAIVTAGDHTSVWEDGRIYTYTKVHVDQGVAGELGAGTDGWVRTMGGVVGKIGQLVDGEAVFVKDKPSLVFMRKFKTGGIYEVSARAQGQYAVTVDETTKIKKLLRSSSVGMLLPPKNLRAEVTQGPPVAGAAQPQSTQASGVNEVAKLRLAHEVMHDRPLDDVAHEVTLAWTRLHRSTPLAK